MQFEQPTYIVNEDHGPIQIVLIFSNPSSNDIAVQVGDIEDTATGESSNKTFNIQKIAVGGGTDYKFTPNNITFTTGVTRVPFNVTIIDDDVFEYDEIFYLNVTTDSLPNGVSIGYPNQTAVTIEDDEGIISYLQFYFYPMCYMYLQLQ